MFAECVIEDEFGLVEDKRLDCVLFRPDPQRGLCVGRKVVEKALTNRLEPFVHSTLLWMFNSDYASVIENHLDKMIPI